MAKTLILNASMQYMYNPVYTENVCCLYEPDTTAGPHGC